MTTPSIASTTAAFAKAYGGEPEGIWTAPGRVNLIGEHTDYNDGFVLPLAIDRGSTVAVRRTEAPVVQVTSRQIGSVRVPLADVAPGRVRGWVSYVVGPIWALQTEGVEPRGYEIFLDSNVPLGAGLSSSAALECSIVSAVSELAGSSLDRVTLALAAQRAEIEVSGVPCGAMDQMASMLATAAHALFLDTRTMSTEQIPLPLHEAGRALLVIDSKAPHRLADGAYAERRIACHRAAELMGVAALRDVTLEQVEAAAGELGVVGHRRARHVVTENARVLEAAQLLRELRVDEIGPLLTASHASMRDDFEITVPEIDVAVEAALAAGAVGARMTGGGFGGCIIALVDAGRVDAVLAGVREAFANSSFTPPQAFVAVASQGARRLA